MIVYTALEPDLRNYTGGDKKHQFILKGFNNLVKFIFLQVGDSEPNSARERRISKVVIGQ